MFTNSQGNTYMAAAQRTHSDEGLSRPDHIREQPDAVLGTIVSLLPTKDGCRTQALSRWWRHIWRSAPLNLDADSSRRGLPGRTISAILSTHLGPIHRISITDIAPLPYRYDRRTGLKIADQAGDTSLESWLGSRDVLASVQVLDLGYRYAYDGCDILPPSVFRFAPALHVATFTRCSLPSNLTVDFPSLEKLSLYKVILTEEALSTVLAGCPALRSLLLEETMGCDHIRISSPALRSIGFSPPWGKEVGSRHSIVKVHELVIEDARCLERLLPLNPDNGPAVIRVVRAPKLEILGRLSKGTSQLHLGTTIFQEMISVSLTTTMRTVKILALDEVGLDLDAVLDFLKCFPCLERLYIVLDSKRFPHPFFKDMVDSSKNSKPMRKYALPDDPIECLEFHLKSVALKVYYGEGLEVEFARFFVLNGRMEFGVIGEHKEKWGDNQNMQLQLDDRASPNAQFEINKVLLEHFQK